MSSVPVGFADDDGVAHLDVLQARGQWAVGHLDRQEPRSFFPVGAGNGVRAQQRLAVHLQADRGEMAVGKSAAGSRVVVKLKRRSVQW